MARFIQVEQRGDVAVVRIDRPPANAMDLELLADGREVLCELAREEPGAVVLTGREGFFSAGVDLKVAPALAPDEQREMVTGINETFTGWYGFPRPVVCAVNGHAIAGGLILALCGDYRIGTSDGKLGVTELKVGIGYPVAAIAVVRAELTPQAARLLALGAGLVDPERGLELGLLDELAAPEELIDRALAVANELAALPRSAYTRVKRQLRGEVVDELERTIGDDPFLTGWIGNETTVAAAGFLARNGS
jgi:enoyl-CoA hydratase